MSTRGIKDPDWVKMYQFLKEFPSIYTGNEEKCRRFVEAVHWMARTGAPLRDLPSEFGKWNSYYKRFCKWDDKGVWTKMHQHFINDPDMEWLLLDSTVIRAHPAAAGAPKKTADKKPKL